jgi:phosphoserine phosphatase RsbU/P
LYGSYIALTPMFVLILYSLSRGGLFYDTPGWALAAAVAAMSLFPAILAYVVIVQRAFGLKVVLRTGLQYVLARRAVRAVQILLSLGVMFGALALATQPGVNRPRTIQFLSLGVMAIFGLQALGARAAAWVDRRFFRDARHTEAVLEALSEDVRTIFDFQPLAETVTRRLAEALHATRVTLLTPAGEAWRPAYALGYEGPAPALDASASLLAYAGSAGKPLRVYFEDEDSWLHMQALPEAELEWLREAGAELLLPLGGKKGLLGLIALGARKSEEPYAGSDLRLLNQVAIQTSLAMENAQLTAAVAEEIAQREILNREVEIAREVQERLFPQNLPAVEGLDYHGYCRPARSRPRSGTFPARGFRRRC